MPFDPQTTQKAVAEEPDVTRSLTRLFHDIAHGIEDAVDGEDLGKLREMVAHLRDHGQSMSASVMANTGLPNPTGSVGYASQAQDQRAALASEGGAPDASDVPVQPYAPGAVEDSAKAGGVEPAKVDEPAAEPEAKPEEKPEGEQ